MPVNPGGKLLFAHGSGLGLVFRGCAYLLVLVLFALSLLALISSLILFLRDTHLAMRAVEHVLRDYEKYRGAKIVR